MRSHTTSQIQHILYRYNADHDIGADCPVTWREERLARAVMEQEVEIKEIKAQIKAILDALNVTEK